uniref:sensor histidine kinase n=1 Tax=Alistipes sp. TaxID=1872444 RepID=UPI0040572594
MILKILLILTIVFQSVASVYAIRLIRKTRYNSIWILFILGFFLLSAERILQLFWVGGAAFPIDIAVWIGIAISVALSISMMYAHKLVNHVDRMERHRQLVDRRILTSVLRAEERSRSQVAKDLHDGLGPLLSSAKMSISALRYEELTPKQQTIVSNTAYVIDEAIRSVREISNNMSPHLLVDFGLARAIRNFIDRCAAIHHAQILFSTSLRNERFDPDVEVILYRVVCELIHNSIKHAHCHKITLSLHQHGESLELSYRDDGRGFNPDALLYSGMGLSNIHSRIHSLGGTLELKSLPNQGMSAKVQVQIKPTIQELKEETLI